MNQLAVIWLSVPSALSKDSSDSFDFLGEMPGIFIISLYTKLPLTNTTNPTNSSAIAPPLRSSHL